MRISTNMLYDLGVGSVNQQYSDLLKLQQQLSTGRRILSPSDDPIGSARALDLTQAQSTNEQYMTNGEAATGALQLQESVLTQYTDLLQNVRTLAVSAGNPSLSTTDLRSISSELRARYQELLGLANAEDGNGQYLFSGYKGKVLPFTESAGGGVTYNGDQGQRLMQVSASRQVPISSSGAEVFQQIRNGNGTFETAAANANTGTGIVSPGSVINRTAWAAPANNQDFTIVFDRDVTLNPPVTTYDIIDNVSGNSVLTGAAPAAAPYPRTFVSDAAIPLTSQGAEPAFDYGISLTITGEPATGDSFSIQTSRTNQDVFDTLKDMINALENPGLGTAAGNTALVNKLNTALSNIDQAQESLLMVRAKVGAALKEVESHRTTSEDVDLQLKSAISDIQDLDYTKAISDLAQKQTNLQAAQQSFLKIQGLSLFNFLQ